MMEYNTAADSSEDGKSASHASLPNRASDGADGRKQDMELDMDIRPTLEGLLICARRPGDHPSPDKDGITSQDRDDITARNKAHSTARSKVHSTAQDNTSGTDSTPDACVTCRLSLNSTAAYLYSLETAPALGDAGAGQPCSTAHPLSGVRVSGGSASRYPAPMNLPCISIEKQGFA